VSYMILNIYDTECDTYMTQNVIQNMILNIYDTECDTSHHICSVSCITH